MGLFEMLIIAVVTLLVVGPERMPEAVRGAAMTLGRLKRMFNSTKEEFEKQIGADDIRLELHNEQIMDNLKKMEADFAEIDSDLNKLTQDDEDRLFMEEDNYQDPPEFRGEDLHAKKHQPEEPFAFNEPPADEEFSANVELTVSNVPPNYTAPQTNKEPATRKKSIAEKSPSTTGTPAPKEAAPDSELSTQQPSSQTAQSEATTILNKNKLSV